jgi:hypothetical protein
VLNDLINVNDVDEEINLVARIQDEIITYGQLTNPMKLWHIHALCKENDKLKLYSSLSSHECMRAFRCIVLSCVGRDHTIGRSPVQGVLSKCL